MLSLTIRASLLAALLGTSACTTPSPALWSEADSYRQIGVRHIQLVHDVAFAPGSAELTGAESKRLEDFIRRQQVGYGDTVEIQMPRDDARLATRRAAVVGERLARAGIGGERSAIAAPNGIRVTVGRSIAIPPACPDWRKADNDGDPSNTPMSNLGCANMRNLGLMIADPSELIVGRAPGDSSAETLAAGVQRYRAGKVTPFNDSETQTTK